MIRLWHRTVVLCVVVAVLPARARIGMAAQLDALFETDQAVAAYRAALAEFERLVAMRPVPPPTILASSCYEAGRLLEASGQRDRAIEMYRRAARVRGAEANTRRAATQALDRLHAP